MQYQMNQALPKFYCIGHKAPVFTPKCDYLHISPNSFPGLNQLIVPDDAYGDKYNGLILSEYTQLFALADLLEKSPSEEYFYMFQYRKFISIDPPLKTRHPLPYAYGMPATEAQPLFPSPEELAKLDGKILIGRHLPVDSIAQHYVKNHLVEDFAAFMVSLHSSGYFDEKRCMDFINCKILLPSSSLGLHRTDIFLRHMEIIKVVWSHFADHFHVQREGYQRRSGGFLLERLQGFLLYEDVIKRRTVVARPGHLLVISDTPVIQPTI